MNDNVITFAESLTIYNVAEECERLKKLSLQGESTIKLDFSALQELDGAGFQLVLSLVKLRAQQCVVLKRPVQGCAAWLTTQLELLGVKAEGA